MKKIFFLVPIYLFISFSSGAQLISAFSPVKTVTQQGDITMAANAITTCNSNCAGRNEIPGGGTTHNQSAGIVIGYIDVDGSSGIGAQTFSSSSATLDMGGIGGCGVIYAYLTWGGFVTTATANYAKRDSIYFQVPGSAVYTKLKADNFVDNTAPYNRTYHCYKDVTNLVKAAGPGSYTAANVVALVGGNNQFAGWSLVVIYSDNSKPLRNLTIFRGLAGVSGTSAVQFPISGFFTPPAPAAVNVKLGFVAYDGDRANPNATGTGPGDSLKFNGVPVFNSKNPQDDIFNSTITNSNAEITRNPSYTNTLGYDADIIALANGTYSYLGNSASNATLRMSSGGETILVDIVTTAIDVFEPEIHFEKTFVNLSGHNPALLGDTIEYTLKIYNRGSDPADSLTVIDSMYSALNYIPGSMSIISGAGTGSYTDAIADDPMDYFAAGNYLKVRLGNGNSATKGGKLLNIAPDSVTSFRFRAAITNDCTIFRCSDSVFNMAYATYYGQTAIQKRSTFSSANGIDPGTGCALTGPTTLKVAVPVCTLPSDTSFSNCSPYNLSNLLPSRPGYSTFKNSSFTTVTTATTSGIYYAIKSVYPASYYLVPCNDTVQINFTSTGACILPVKLQEFTAGYNKPSVEINWTTSQEINNHHFELERSIDGIHFEKIAQVAGAINSNSPKSYQYTDNQFPKTARLYYRLMQVDLDGISTVSPVKTVAIPEFSSHAFIIEKIIPNPVKDLARINLFAEEDKMIQVRLIDILGKTTYTRTQKLDKGNSQVMLDATRLSKGIYLVEISDMVSGYRVVERFVVN